MPEHPTTKVARNLTEITRLWGALSAQAVTQASAQVDGHSLPGGEAMVALGPVASIEAWTWMEDATERLGKAYTSVSDEDPDEAWSPYQTLRFWSEAWRAERGEDYEIVGGYTIATEINYLRSALDWAWENETGWEDFATDVGRARVKVENILHAGKRQELTRIRCDRCTDDPPRLLHLMGSADDGSEDAWKCPRCKHRFDAQQVHHAHARMLRSESAEKWVHQADAISVLRTQGRSESTVRSWLGRCQAEAYCDPVTHQVYVWWPSLWRLHLTAPASGRRVRSGNEEPVA